MDPMTTEFILGHVNYWLFVMLMMTGKKNRWLEHFSGVGVYAVHLGG